MAVSSVVRRAVAESVGSALLAIAVVGSGIMGERLAGGSEGLALLTNSLATGAALVALILALGPISGAHFNPVVTLENAWSGGMRWSEVPAYLAAQILGAVCGVVLANTMFGKALTWSRSHRGGWPLLLGELVATFGLVAVIRGCARRESSSVAYAVAAYITAAYWFTSSTIRPEARTRSTARAGRREKSRRGSRPAPSGAGKGSRCRFFR